MKLYDLDRPSHPVKIYGLKASTGEKVIIYFHHIDGMYSYCTLNTPDGNVVHLWAATPIDKYKDGYRVIEDI